MPPSTCRGFLAVAIALLLIARATAEPETGAPRSHWARFELREPIAAGEGTEFRLRLHQLHGGGHLIGRFRVSATSHAAPLPIDDGALPPEIAAVLATAPAARSEDRRRRLAAWPPGF